MRTLFLSTLLISGCAMASGPSTELAKPVEAGQAEAIFAGGCFWCIESDFEKLDGVIEAESGYTGGTKKGPSYKEVGYGKTTHLEGIRVIYDPKKVSYEKLVDYFFHHVDPTQANGQFCDIGRHYTTAVFVANEEERKVASAAKKQAEKVLTGTVVTPILDASEFWLAEDYHQDFYKKNPAHYNRYRQGCGRDAQVKRVWGGKH